MKFSTVWRGLFLTVSLFFVSLVVHGQGLPEVQISVAFRQEPLRNVLNYLERETGVKFVYSASQLDLDENVTVNITYASLGTILQSLLGPRNIRYIPQEGTPFVVLVSAPVDAQGSVPIHIKGEVVTAGNNLPLSFVSIIVKGTTRGTITDVNGKYSLDAGFNDVLVFTYVGFEHLEIPVDGRGLINISMKEDVSNLNEIMVNAGYWKLPQREQTGNIARVDADQIAAQPVSNVLQALQGNAPGIEVLQANGTPGGYFSVDVRGRNSIRPDGNAPLYIVDGVPYTSLSYQSTYTPAANLQSNPLSAINPSDVQSIEILKDADATAIYGTRGANGVVLITTRRSRKGPTQVGMNIYSGLGQVARRLKLLNSQQWLEMRREAFKNDNIVPTAENAPELFTWDTTRYTDWQKELIGGTANITNGQVTIDGGDEHTQFSLSTGFRRETTVFPGDFEYKRASAHFSLNHSSPNDKFRVNFNTQFVGEENALPQDDPTSVAISTIPIAPPAFDSLGNLSWQTSTNPYANLYRTYAVKARTLITNVMLQYTPLTDLHCRVNMGYTMYRGRETGLEPIKASYPSPLAQGYSRLAITGSDGWVAEPVAEYTRFVGQGKFNVLAGLTFQENVRQTDAFIGRGYTSDALLSNLNAAPYIEANQTDHYLYRYMAAFARINYGLRDKYFINLTGRRDGSSRFGREREFANFGALGLAWIFSEEKFAERFPISFGKLRASYGLTGSDQIGDYQYASTFEPALYPYDGGEAIIPTRLVNQKYGWESNRKFELATDLGLVRDRIYVTLCWYNNRSGNQLVGYPLPAITGKPSVQYNLAAIVENTGWEITLRTINIHQNHFSWTTTGNIAIPRNRLVSYPGLQGSSYANTLEIGKSLYLYRTYHAVGVNQTSGLYEIQDVDGNGAYDEIDYRGAVERGKKFYGAISNTLQYRGWSLDFMFQFVKQKGFGIHTTVPAWPGSRSNQPVEVMQRWQKPGDNASVQRFTALGGLPSIRYLYYLESDARYEDASFIRLRSVSLSWQLPATWISRMHLQAVKLYMQGQNVLTFTKNKTMEPGVVNPLSIPPLRIISFGFMVSL